jgi:hypothetical protein
MPKREGQRQGHKAEARLASASSAFAFGNLQKRFMITAASPPKRQHPAFHSRPQLARTPARPKRPTRAKPRLTEIRESPLSKEREVVLKEIRAAWHV